MSEPADEAMAVEDGCAPNAGTAEVETAQHEPPMDHPGQVDYMEVDSATRAEEAETTPSLASEAPALERITDRVLRS